MIFDKTVDKVLETFTKAISDLSSISSCQRTKEQEFQDKAAAAGDEAAHAERVLEKLRDLVE